MAETLRVLVVDASSGGRELVRVTLAADHNNDYDLTEADSLAQGLQLLDRADLVLLDLELPDARGVQGLARLRAAGFEGPILVLSSRRDEAQARELLQAGAQDYLVKDPSLEGVLSHAFTFAVERQQLRRLAVDRLAQLEHREASFRSLAASADGMIVLVDGRVRYANPAAERLLGRAGVDLLGSSLALELLEGTPREQEFTRRDGTTVLAETRSTETVWEGQPGWVVNLRDISGRRELAERVRMAQALTLVGRLAGGVAHDFNNLLTGMLGHLDMLAEDLAGTAHDKSIAALIDGAERAARLTQRLLAFANRQVVQPKAVDINKVVEHLERWLTHLCGDGVNLMLRLEDGLPRVEADPLELDQILFNLVGNARDAVVSGGRVTVRTRYELADEPWVVIEVQDDGHGIPESVQQNLFEPFVTTKEASGGIGLGLPTVADIVERRGGTITFETGAEGGTTFIVRLPPSRPGSTLTSDSFPPIAAEEPEARRILVVDDDQAIRQLLKAALETAGFVVEVAPDGAEGLARGRELAGTIDLLITDVMMPGLRGDELAAKLQKAQPGLRALLISGFARDALGEDSLPGPGLAFLAKPFRTGELLRQVRLLLNTPD